MKHEPPVRTGRPRTDAAARLAALLSDVDEATPPPAADGPPAPAVADPPAASSPPPSPPTRPPTADASPVAPRRRSRLRTTAFAAALVLLVAAIPALGYTGARTILSSRGGKVQAQNTDPRAPGFQASVDPTPTALVLQHDADGAPTAATLLSLGTGDAGGSVLFIPLDTNVLTPALFVDRLRTAYVRGGQPNLVGVTAELLNIGFSEVIDLDDATWTELVAPVAPLTVDNPHEVVVGGETIPAGPILLRADQVAPYLAATRDDQDDLDRLVRHRALWEAWLAGIASSASPTPVPNTTTGLGPFVETFAEGLTQMDTLAVDPAAALAPDGAKAFTPDVPGITTQVTDAVPAPVSPGLGDRFSVRLLNGVTGDPLPVELVQRLVYVGAQINTLGNANRFGTDETRIEYHETNRRGAAQSVRFQLGVGAVVANLRSNDPVDLIVIVGRDALEALKTNGGGVGGAGG